jgi:hypothetical protein
MSKIEKNSRIPTHAPPQAMSSICERPVSATMVAASTMASCGAGTRFE